MQMTTERPKSGEFIAVWEYGDSIWSDTYHWKGDQLYVYDSSEDDWVDVTLEWFEKQNCTHYVIKGEDQ